MVPVLRPARLAVTCCLTLAIHSHLPGQFAPGQRVGPGAAGGKVDAVDMDGDGHPDLVVLHDGRRYEWHRNTDGLGSFAPALVFNASDTGYARSVLADLDGDGAADLVYMEHGAADVLVAWNDGSGVFAAPVLLGSIAGGAGGLDVADLTGNGWPEVALVVSESGMVGLAWFPNTAGGFAPMVKVGGLFPGGAPVAMAVGDLDGSGGRDVLVVGEDQAATALMNGNGDATSWDLLRLFQHFGYPFTAPRLLDVDGDGDLDVAEAAEGALQWAENRLNEGGAGDLFVPRGVEPHAGAGIGVFGPTGCGIGATAVYIPSDPALPVRWSTYLPAIQGFAPRVGLAGVGRGSSAVLADLDGDGRNDLALVGPEGVFFHRNMIVPPTTVVETPVMDTLCRSGPAVLLPEASPAGGQWSGDWVEGDLFHRANHTTTGTYSLAYTVYEEQGCPVGAPATVRLVSGPEIQPLLGPVVCSGDGPFQMTSEPSNTLWDGLSDGNILDLATYDGGVITCVYTDTTGFTCVSFMGPLSVWATLPADIQPAGPFCTTDSVQTILPESDFPNSAWSGDITGSTSSMAFFDPSQGPGVYMVVLSRYPTGPRQCENSDTLLITVSDVIPEVTVVPLPPYCASGAPIVLGGATPDGGIWSGPGVSGNELDPAAAGAGTHTVTYSYRAPEGCSNSAGFELVLADATTVGWTVEDLLFCPGDDAVVFTAAPAGGTWTAPVDRTGGFDPSAVAVGAYPLVYAYTDPRGCMLVNAPDTIEVRAVTNVSIDPIGSLCLGGGLATLTGSHAGTWSGAVSGEGSSVTIDPDLLGLGTWTIHLEAAAPGECPGMASIDVTVTVCTGIDGPHAMAAPTLAPNPFSGTPILSFGAQGAVLVEVFDATGRAVLQRSISAHGHMVLPIDIGGQPNGSYAVRVTAGDGTVWHLRAVKAE